MVKKKLIQKLQQLIDNLPISKKRKEAEDDLLSLKLTKTYYYYISVANKYKEL